MQVSTAVLITAVVLLLVVLAWFFSAATFAAVLPRFYFTPASRRRKLLDHLTNVCDELDRNSIKYSIACGTLLGAFREERIIPWDDDTDICVLEDNISRIEKLFRGQKAYKVSAMNFGLKIENVQSAEVWTDVFALNNKRDKNVYEYRESDATCINRWRPNEYMLADEWNNLGHLTLTGRKFHALRDPTRYLKQAYGDDVMTTACVIKPHNELLSQTISNAMKRLPNYLITGRY